MFQWLIRRLADAVTAELEYRQWREVEDAKHAALKLPKLSDFEPNWSAQVVQGVPYDGDKRKRWEYDQHRRWQREHSQTTTGPQGPVF